MNLKLKRQESNTIAIFESTTFKTRHPVVHVHDETGKKHLLLGGFAGQLEGYSTCESKRLLGIFDSYVTRLENTTLAMD